MNITESLLYGSGLRNWIRLLRRYGPPDSGGHMLKAAVTTLTIGLLTPLRFLQAGISGRARPGRTTSSPDLQMVFVVGFYRSGTTHVHRLLTSDPNNAFLDIVYCLFPNFAAAGGTALRRIVRLLLPADRGSDGMKLSIEFPEEDEYALCNSSPSGLYHATFFPKHWPAIYAANMFDEGKNREEEAQWLRDYRRVLDNGLAYFEKTRSGNFTRLVLKNPANMTRIKALLRAYPQAKFVFVKRSPQALFPSLLNYYRKEIDLLGYQDTSNSAIEENVLRWYKTYTQSFLATRSLIGAANLCEVRFEDVEKDPLGELERIYRHFGFDGFADAKPRAEQYLCTISGYRKNKFTLSARDARVIADAWGIAFDELDYPKPEVP